MALLYTVLASYFTCSHIYVSYFYLSCDWQSTLHDSWWMSNLDQWAASLCSSSHANHLDPEQNDSRLTVCVCVCLTGPPSDATRWNTAYTDWMCVFKCFLTVCSVRVELMNSRRASEISISAYNTTFTATEVLITWQCSGIQVKYDQTNQNMSIYSFSFN